MSGRHIPDLAEAYALGLLDDSERAGIDAHVATCDACLRLIGQAEETVAALASALPSHRPSAALTGRLSASLAAPAGRDRPRFAPAHLRAFAPLATAAVLALALGGSLVQNGQLRGELAQEDHAREHVVHGHFLHVSMTPAHGQSLVAKVLYARDGSWIYVLADRPPNGTHVVAVIDGVERDLGMLTREGAVASLAADVAKPSAVSLREGARTLASADLRY